ncbi:hypothetical protein [Dyella psychrodurans]|uniref:Uncharacterized protein n=1 Tax=Dyella psychrodurans TaxID=1927960 RepID=A0A370XCS8_9GAMM|nr:hypothetical protein [Dyella psychrodurans]RDS86206.1 hypothetical protein DWU99_02775 [Dyella psychrodurans]
MQSNSMCENYRGYQIIAIGEACEVLHDQGRIDHFARKYLRLDVPAELVLALLVDEAEERIDAIFMANECPSRLTVRRQQRDRTLAG